MANVKFCSGSDITIKLSGTVIGGVKKAVCTQKITYNDSYQFLSDVPVCSETEVMYEIELILNYETQNPFVGLESFDSIEFVCGDNKTEYCNCRVLSISNCIKSNVKNEDTVIIKAEKRNVSE